MNYKQATPPTRIIPTPWRLEPFPGAGRSWQSECRLVVAGGGGASVDFAVTFLRQRLVEQFGLRVRTVAIAGHQMVRDDDILMCGNGDARIAHCFRAQPTPMNALAREQGYVITARDGEPVMLYATASTGLLYAAATFLQLLIRHGNHVHLSNVVVQDQPAYRWRGNSWLLHGERFGWSYGRGNGARAYEQRIIRKLDLCVMHKVNFLHFEGFDWVVDKFPGYAAMMRRLNDQAKLRGIRLSFGGEGAFQAGFTNRRSYPHGEEYPCIGYHNDEQSRIAGTCLSNRALLKLRQARMATFIRKLRPGAIYLHNIDTGTVADSVLTWKLRCPACRQRWPNDDIIAPDGMAGAYAAFYDAIALTIHGVDPDCILTVVSPGYTSWDESDADWEQASRYWLTVSRCLRDRRVHIGLREQFINHGNARLRLPELRRRLDRDGNGHPISTLLFYGGETFYNGHPFLAVPVLSSYFEGSELVVSGNGTAFQEPQQLLTAECLWNPTGSRYFTPTKPRTYTALNRQFLRLSNGIDRPRTIWGPSGFLDDACHRLYGHKAGPLVARLYRLMGKARLGSPSFARCERTFVWLPAYHYHHPTIYSRSLRHGGVVWRKDRDRQQETLSRRLAAVYRETTRLNCTAAVLARRAARLCSEPHAAEDLVWIAECLDAARRCADLLAEFVELFCKAHRAATTGQSKPRVLAAVAAFSRRAAAFDRAEKRKLPRKVLPDEIELIARHKTGARLERFLAPMRQTLSTGQWP